MRTIARIAAYLVAGVAVLVLGLIVTAEFRWNRTFAAPLPAITASRDSQVIARGRYLVFGPAHCVGCHMTPGTTDLAGGMVMDIPPGKFHVRNITPDSETGIGRRTDGELARMLRYGVKADGQAALPFMAYQNLSDEDLTAIVSFLRSQTPVRHAVPPHEYTLIGKIVKAFVIKPTGPKVPPPARTPAPDSPAYGEYLADAVAECAGCHTQRSFVTGAFTGPRFAGGAVFAVDKDPTLELVTPNLTSDPSTGRTGAWSEEQFITRFRAGALIPQTVMPWVEFGRMSDGDLRAIYRYIRSVPAVHIDQGPSLRKKE